MNIEAIPTVYKDTTFRSRLEVRWAEFLDAHRVAWQYEVKTFDVGEHGLYLPDFHVPEWGDMWVEIKPWNPAKGSIWKPVELAKKENVLLLMGEPYPERHWVAFLSEMYGHRPGPENLCWFDGFQQCDECLGLFAHATHGLFGKESRRKVGKHECGDSSASSHGPAFGYIAAGNPSFSRHQGPVLLADVLDQLPVMQQVRRRAKSMDLAGV